MTTKPRKSPLVRAALAVVLAAWLLQGAAFADGLTSGREKLEGTSQTQGDFSLQNRFSLQIDGVTHTVISGGINAVVAGSSVTITATTSGSPTPTYQWKKNGVSIAGATSAAYTISGASASDAGTYTVVAANPVGAVTSTGAVLKVGASSSR